MTQTQKTSGVDRGALFQALDAVKAQPEAAKFQFRARNEWISGTHNRSTIHDFFGLGEEQTHMESHTYEADDGVLIDAAIEAGAEFRDRTTMTDLLRDSDGRVAGVQVGRGRQRETITASFVIGADGHRSRVAEGAGSSIYRSHRPTNTVHYGYYEGVDADGFWFQFTPGVNAGLIPTNDDQCLVFAGRPEHRRQQFTDNPDAEFHRLLHRAGNDLAERVREGTRVGRFRGTSGLAGFIRQAWGPGWALVGDAGYTKDPISAHGISDALRDAELCARAIDQALHTPELGDEALAWYERLRNSMSRRMYEESEALARFDWTAEEASARMRVVSDEIRAECETLLSLPDWSDTPALTHV